METSEPGCDCPVPICEDESSSLARGAGQPQLGVASLLPNGWEQGPEGARGPGEPLVLPATRKWGPALPGPPVGQPGLCVELTRVEKALGRELEL